MLNCWQSSGDFLIISKWISTIYNILSVKRIQNFATYFVPSWHKGTLDTLLSPLLTLENENCVAHWILEFSSLPELAWCVGVVPGAWWISINITLWHPDILWLKLEAELTSKHQICISSAQTRSGKPGHFNSDGFTNVSSVPLLFTVERKVENSCKLVKLHLLYWVRFLFIQSG